MSGVMPLTTENLRLYVVASRNILKADLEQCKKKMRSLPAGEHTNLAEKRDLQQKITDIRMNLLQTCGIDSSIDALSKISFGTFEMLAPSLKRRADEFWPTSPAKYLKLDMDWTRGRWTFGICTRPSGSSPRPSRPPSSTTTLPCKSFLPWTNPSTR